MYFEDLVIPAGGGAGLPDVLHLVPNHFDGPPDARQLYQALPNDSWVRWVIFQIFKEVQEPRSHPVLGLCHLLVRESEMTAAKARRIVPFDVVLDAMPTKCY